MIRPVLTEIGIFLIPFAVYAAFLIATRSGTASIAGVMAAACRRQAGDRRAAAGRGQLRAAGAFLRRAAGFDLRSGAYRERQTRSRSREMSGPARCCSMMRRWLDDPVRPRRVLALLNGDGEEARVVGGAVRNALLRIAGRRYRHRDHGAARRGDPPRQGGRHQERADRHRARHRHAGGRRRSRSRSPRCARTSKPSAARRRSRSAATGCAMPSGATSPSTGCRSTRAGVVHDHVGGLDDLAARRVRFIGDPDARIAEDYLRILRFFRIHAAYGAGEPDRAGYPRLHRRPRRPCRRCPPSACAWKC